MNKYLIRFNTKNNGDSGKIWRVFENGAEHLVADLKITSPVWSETSFENGAQKWNIATEGFMMLVNNVAHIQPVLAENFDPSKQYMNAEELMAAGYISHPSAALHAMIEKSN